MNNETGTVLFICPACGKSNDIKYGEKLYCNDCIYADKKEKTMMYDWENPQKINHSSNWLLNKVGNLCGRVGHFISRPYYKWGTFWTFDLQEDIDKVDEVW